MATASDIAFEHWNPAKNVLGIGTGTPRLSWTVLGAGDGNGQTGYEIEVARDGSGASAYEVTSAEHVLVPWPASPLRSRERAMIRVRVRDRDGWGQWSDMICVETGLLRSSDWLADFIAPAGIGGMGEPAPRLFRSFAIPEDISKARLYITAHGLYQATVNGHDVTDTVLNPGWTSYRHRLRYQCFDVTDALHKGGNEISVLLGDGWWRGHLKWEGRKAFYGDELAVCAQLEIELAGGKRMTVCSDPLWHSCESLIRDNSLYNGSTIDYMAGMGMGCMHGVRIVDQRRDQLVASDGPLMRRTGVLHATRIWRSPAGKLLVDFGQNAVGWVRLKVRGLAAGHVVSVRHAEVLEHDELGTRPLRKAKAMDTYVLDGPSERVLEPVFTVHGFRYAQVDGLDELAEDDIEFVLVGTDLRRIGFFDCSDPMLNRLFSNVIWSTRSNFVDIPTDCPQRDERLGWTGDIQVFGPTALYLFDVSGLLTSWLKDVAAEQYADGGIPLVVPEPDAGQIDPTACAWGDAAVIVPWNVYQATGDRQVLERQIGSMRAWVDHVAKIAGPSRLWEGGFQFGDWLDPTAPPDKPWQAKASPDVVATACFARCAGVLAEAYRAIGDISLAGRYDALAGDIRAAFRKAYVGVDGRIRSDAQTVYAAAIHWNVLSDDERVLAGKRLAELVAQAGYRIATGFIGTPIICDALCDTGHADAAWRLLLQRECPSWMYPIIMGATTTWERWDSMLPDGRINPGEMTSFNHYALGSVVDWMVRSIAGLSCDAPGWRLVTIRPWYCDRLDHASASHLSPYGMIDTAWECRESVITVSVTLPEGVHARVTLPDGAVHDVGLGFHEWNCDLAPIADSITEGDCA